MLKLIQKIGLFRIVLTPIGVWIIYTAFERKEWLMALVGLVVLIFGLLNRCLTTGKCATDFNPPSQQ
ncbi:MAG: hypothetical protein JNK50_15440 [Bacteroidia bacterium]|nr:hypothetical protein [Bacteroidia bacterium]